MGYSELVEVGRVELPSGEHYTSGSTGLVFFGFQGWLRKTQTHHTLAPVRFGGARRAHPPLYPFITGVPP